MKKSEEKLKTDNAVLAKRSSYLDQINFCELQQIE